MRPMTVGGIKATCGPPVRSWEWNGLNAEVAIGPFMTQLCHSAISSAAMHSTALTQRCDNVQPQNLSGRYL
jgi:hypothetical protein